MRLDHEIRKTIHVTTLVARSSIPALASPGVEHHLIDNSFPGLLVRPATIDDTPVITQLSTSDLPLSEEALDAAQTIVAERLAVESGDDYFTIVAEQKTTHKVVGWLAAGGCRGQELKGWGELYALSSLTDENSAFVDEALVGVALNALHLAQFSGVTTLVDGEDQPRREMFTDFGFTTDLLEVADDAEVLSHLVRYSLSFRK